VQAAALAGAAVVPKVELAERLQQGADGAMASGEMLDRSPRTFRGALSERRGEEIELL
jgi:hypothetical protein